jgi:hypothetical protein
MAIGLLISGRMIGLLSSFVEWMQISISISVNMMKILSMLVNEFCLLFETEIVY